MMYQTRYKIEDMLELVPASLKPVLAEVIAAVKRGDPEEQLFSLPQSFNSMQSSVNAMQSSVNAPQPSVNVNANYWSPNMAPPFIVPNQTFMPHNTPSARPLACVVPPPVPAALNGGQVPHQTYPAPLANAAASGIANTGGLANPPAYVTPVSQVSVATGGNIAPIPKVPSGTPVPPQVIDNAVNEILTPPMQNLDVGLAREVNGKSHQIENSRHSGLQSILYF